MEKVISVIKKVGIVCTAIAGIATSLEQVCGKVKEIRTVNKEETQ